MKDSVTSIFCSKRLLLEIIPGLAFLIAYFLAGLMFSVACLLLATIVCSAIAYMDERRVAILPIISILLISVLGLLSLVFTDPDFVKIRVTLSYCLFALILLASLKRQRPLLQEVFDGQLFMIRAGWVKTTIAWAVLNFLFALLNELIWRTQSTTVWVVLDSIMLPVLILLYIVTTRYYGEKYWLDTDEAD